MRLASLTCSNTEILAALGLAGQLVAVDSHSDAQGAQRAERLGPDLNIDVARLAALKPDLTLTSLSVPGMERVLQEVQAAGLSHLTLDPVSLADVYTDIRTVGERLGRSGQAGQLVQGLQAELAALRRPFARPPRVVVEWWPRPLIVAGRDSWITDLLRALGAENAFASLERRSGPVTLDDLRAARPDLQVLAWCGVKKLRPEVAQSRGLATPIACIPESGLGRPGPRLIEGARALSAALEAFIPAPA